MERDLLQILFKESEAYQSIDYIAQQGRDLSQYPIEPLYLGLKSLAPEQAASYLPLFSPQQRQIFLDLDLWYKDSVDVEGFKYWPQAYVRCADESVRREFARSSEFLLFLKARFNIWSFDIEDPQYPDHDNYFLTDDNLLLFEYDGDFEHVREIQNLIRELYAEVGVESAYVYLFKMVSDSFLPLQEDEYQSKKERLADVGFVDYLSALKLDAPFASLALMDNFIVKKIGTSAEISELGKKQVLPPAALAAYKEKMGFLSEALLKLESEKRRSFLQFNFIRLVNASLTLEDALKHGAVAMTRAGNRTRNLLELGLNYINTKVRSSEVIFETFDFTDIYRVGNTLIKMGQRRLKRALRDTSLKQERDVFLGGHWLDFWDNSFDVPPKYSRDKYDATRPLCELQDYYAWDERIKSFETILPFVDKLYVEYQALVDSGQLQDSFYLNYAVAEVDFETILISSLAQLKPGKLGLTIAEYRTFASQVIDPKGYLRQGDEIKKYLRDFLMKFGMDGVYNALDYLRSILKEHMEGYDYSKLADEDFKHVGGPIILNVLQ